MRPDPVAAPKRPAQPHLFERVRIAVTEAPRGGWTIHVPRGGGRCPDMTVAALAWSA